MVTEKKMLYFSREFTWLREHSAQAPLTIICAPSGYGKTIALRSMTNPFDGKMFRLNLYRSRQQDFYEEFCRTVLDRTCSATTISELIKNGIPKTTLEAEPIIECLKKVCGEEQCLIAIDDFCRVEKPEYTEFLYYIANELKQKLRIIITASHIDLANMEERVTKGEIFYISKDDLRLKEKDIQPYFFVNDAEISVEEARKIYKQSEGWFAKLYVILRHYRMSGTIEGYDVRSLVDMVKHNNYLLLPGECKRFLNRVFPAKTFTRESGIFWLEAEKMQSCC